MAKKERITFKDVTSYSRRDKKKIPQTFEARIAGVRLTVTRHIYYRPDQWVVSTSDDLIHQQPLESTDLQDAMQEAVNTLMERCKDIYQSCKQVTID